MQNDGIIERNHIQNNENLFLVEIAKIVVDKL